MKINYFLKQIWGYFNYFYKLIKNIKKYFSYLNYQIWFYSKNNKKLFLITI